MTNPVARARFASLLHRCSILCLIGVAGALGLTAGLASQAPSRRHLLIVVDGLRPDQVTADAMPRLTALGRRGVVFTQHHAVYPSVTRVNAASIATGAYPESHGLMGNSVFFPRVDARKFLDTADRFALARIAESEGGRLLTVPTLGDALRAAGRRLLVVSSGSPGSAVLNNATMPEGSAILHTDFAVPERYRAEMQALSPLPVGEGDAQARDRYAVDAFLKVGVPKVDPAVTVLWLGALDSTAHARGLGRPVVAVLQHLDREIGRVEDGLAAAGLLDQYDIWVTSDHGFSTHTGAAPIATLLEPFARTLPDGSPRIVASGGAIYVRDQDEPTVAAIVAVLQKTPGIGAIFTRGDRAGATSGHVAGTLSFNVARWDHERAAQILFSPDWTDAPNADGVRGSVASGGTAGHGSASPWDIHNTLIAAGPDLARGVTIDVPSSNVDFTPTFLTLLGVAVPSSVRGRVLREALADGGPSMPRPSVQTTDVSARTPDGRYVVTARVSTVRVVRGTYRYLDGTTVSRR